MCVWLLDGLSVVSGVSLYCWIFIKTARLFPCSASTNQLCCDKWKEGMSDIHAKSSVKHIHAIRNMRCQFLQKLPWPHACSALISWWVMEDCLLGTKGTPQLCQHLYVGETAGRLYVWTNSHGQSHHPPCRTHQMKSDQNITPVQ